MDFKNTCRVLLTLLAMIAVPMVCSADECIMGDINCDGALDFQDIPALIDLIESGGFMPEADFTCDGFVDEFDIPCFIDALAEVE